MAGLPSVRRHASAIVIFVAGCLISAGLAKYSRKAGNRVEALRFSSEMRLASLYTAARLERYVNALIHTKALFAVEKQINRQQFRRYVDDLDVFQKYPGTLGIGFAPAGNGIFIVTSMEPAGPFARTIVGHVLNTGPVRHEAIQRAVRSGLPTLSARIEVETPTHVREPGFLMLNPIFKRGKPTETQDERGRAIKGVVFSVFRASTFFEDLFRQNPLDPMIDLDVYDGALISPEALLFERYPGAEKQRKESGIKQTQEITVAGRTWTLDFRERRQFRSEWAAGSPYFIFAIGALISYLLAQLVWSMQSGIDTERRLVGQVKQTVASRDEFISIASHELKTPITSLKLQLAMARRYPDKAPQMIADSDKQVSRLNALIDELLDMTRIQVGKMKYDFEDTDLSALVRDIGERYRTPLQEAGCELRIAPGTPVMAQVDRFRIEQVLVNLLGNAMKYARGKPVDLAVERDGPNAVIRVTDHGAGIPPEKQALIFKRFERVSENRGISGLGLGLYITRQIVEAHGGTIRVLSEVGQGSAFVVELPSRHPNPKLQPSIRS